jgi:hypothetical protein
MVLSNNNPSITWGDAFVQYPAVANIVNEISEIQARDSEKQTAYLHTIIDFWENDLDENN